MNEASWLKIVLSMQSRILSGFVYLYNDERLLDVLNGVSRRTESRTEILELSDVEIKSIQGDEEYRASVYIMKPSIDMVVTWEKNGGRGIGAKRGYKEYPFTLKQAVTARVELPKYSLSGRVHCPQGQMASHLLVEKTPFMPMTDVSIDPPENNLWSNVAFVAVNRGQILCLQQEGIPLLQVSHN